MTEQGRGKKIVVLKFKRRANYKRVKGHRQHYTEVEVTSISTSAPKKVAKESQPAEADTAPKKVAKKKAAKKTAKKAASKKTAKKTAKKAAKKTSTKS